MNTIIDAKKTGPDPNREIYRTGQQDCPCFCSERNDDSGYNTFWVDKYKTEIPEEFQCSSTNCLNPSDYSTELGLCKEHVDYKFCPRKSLGWNKTSTSLYVTQLANDAFNCWDTTVWKENTDCDKIVRKGACYTAFPKCEDKLGVNQTSPKKICRSVCENERKVCRNLKSAFGPNEYIKDVCSGDPYVDEAGPHDSCTGIASNVFHNGYYIRTLILCAMNFLLIFMLLG